MNLMNTSLRLGFLTNKNEANKLGKATYRREIAKAIYEAIVEFKTQNELDVSDKFGSVQGGARDQFDADYAELNPYPFASLDETLDHFDHVVNLTGSVDYVGIGSDYDGVGDTLPIDLKDVSTYPNLIEGLLKRGYSKDAIQKILGGNLLRVWRAVEAAAEH